MKFKLTEAENLNETEALLKEDLDNVVNSYQEFLSQCRSFKKDLENVGADDIAIDIDYFLNGFDPEEFGRQVKWLDKDINKFIYGEEEIE